MRSAVALALALAGAPAGAQPSSVPVPIGPGPAYLPPPAPAAVRAGQPVGALRCSAPGAVFALHLELFANRRVVVVPAGIGVAAPFRQNGATVTPGGCVYPASTLTPTGVVRVARGARLRLADVFAIWGQRLGSRALASFRSSSPLRAYVGGRRVSGPASAIPLTPHAEIVLELGGYVPPHRFFLFSGSAA
jgi:hypothetical protein